jgi:uncharacterized peroxidase-related enzyme
MSRLPSADFTLEPLVWSPWVETVDLATASEEQRTAVQENGSPAGASPYYLTLAHQPEMLRRRSATFNAIMYAPGGLPRAERELAATAVSRVNGCIYCASVHGRRFEQLAKRLDPIPGVFADPDTASADAREQAIIDFSVRLTEAPDQTTAADVKALRDAGLKDLEIVDLIHSVAIFAWANRLMLNLGEPVSVQT